MENWQQYLENQDWINDLKENPIKYHIMMNNDADGLISAALLRHYTGLQVKEIYDFKAIYTNGIMDTERIAVDCGLVGNTKQFDNHVQRYNSSTLFPNYSINPNYHVTTNNYKSKYAMSTALVILSIFSNWHDLTDEQKLMYLSVDSGYLGYYSRTFQFTWINNFITLFPQVTTTEILLFMANYSKEFFAQFKRQYNLQDPINVVNGTLQTQINVEKIEKILGISLWLPSKTWCTSLQKLLYLSGNLDKNLTSLVKYADVQEKIKQEKLFSIAYTGGNHVCLTASID